MEPFQNNGAHHMYKYEWANAIARTERLGLSDGLRFIEMESRRILNDKNMRKIPKALTQIIKPEMGFRQLANECVSIHLMARDVIEKCISLPVFLTLGWVETTSTEESNLYEFTEQDIQHKLIHGHHTPTMEIHAWLTLPSYEIIDLTLSTTFAVNHNQLENAGKFIAKKADDVTGLIYRPMLVGDKYLEKIGVKI